MAPFHELRRWLRGASPAERGGTLVAATIVLGLLGWTVVPAAQPGPGTGIVSSPAAPAGTTVPGAAPATSSNPNVVAGGQSQPAVIAPAGGAGSDPANVNAPSTDGAAATAPTVTSPDGCVSPPGDAPGVTDSTIKIAIIEVGIFGPAGNRAFAEPSPQEQHDWYQAVVDDINASGGIACRKVAPTYYSANPADQNDLQAKCLDIAASDVFAVIDIGAYGPFPQKDCYAQHHIPFFTGYIMTAQEQQKFYPYLFASETFETLYRNTVFALRDRGFFSAANGFRKLGFVYQSCFPYLIQDVRAWLREAGVPDSKIVTYDVGCPAATPSPAAEEQAVLGFQRAGVTHVTTADFVGGLQGFSTAAQQQHFHPKYGIPDDYFIPISYGTQHPDYKNLDHAIAITANRSGEEHTSGLHPTAPTARCNAILARHHYPPVYKQPSGLGGMICSELWLFKAAVEHAPVLAREALAAGFQSAQSVPLAYPEGPNSLAAPHNTVWMNYWRVDEFYTSCKCWRVIDRTFHPSYS